MLRMTPLLAAAIREPKTFEHKNAPVSPTSTWKCHWSRGKCSSRDDFDQCVRLYFGVDGSVVDKNLNEA